jgi:hypothetical protein
MTIVAVPYKPDFGHRDQLFTHLKDNFWNMIGLKLSVGSSTEDPFNRSKAINQALQGDWEFAVIADADTWVPAKNLRHALLTAKATGKLVAAFDAVVELNRPCTMSILNGQTSLSGSFGAEKVRTRELETQSSVLVIPRALWERVGRMDERFQGWGCEDNAFWHACSLMGGEPERIPGNAYHLWHAAAPGKFQGIQYRRNLNLLNRYLQAGTVEELKAI